MLAGKILGNRVMGAKKVYDILSGVWRCQNPWFVKEIKPGLLQFNFRDKFDKERVLGGRPWTVKGSQLIIQNWPAMRTIDEISFDWSPFWLRLGGLPPGFHNLASAKELAPMFGRFIGFSSRNVKMVTLRTEMNVSKTVKAGFFLDRGKMGPLWIQGKYENLGRICYKCGVLGHEEEECVKTSWIRVMAEHSPEVQM